MRTHRLAVLVASSLALAGLTQSAVAQLDADSRRCIDQYNNKARTVAAAQGEVDRACVKAAGRGDETDPEACLACAPGRSPTRPL
jgi:hypothetical protein